MGKTIKSTFCCIKLIGLAGGLTLTFIAASAINFINAVLGYNMDMFDGLWNVSSVAYAMVILMISTLVPMSYTNQYKLLTAFPMKLDTVPAQITLITDLIYLTIALLDIIFMAIYGIREGILLKMTAMLVMYAFSHIIGYICVRMGFKSYGITGKVVSGIICCISYSICAPANMITAVLICENAAELRSNVTVLLTALAVSALAAVIVRIVTYKGIKNCVRQIKVYKIKKRVKEEVYV